MASSTFNFNTVGQKRHLSLTLCKYPSTLNLFSFHYSSHLSFSPPKHILKTRISPFFVVRAHTRHTPAKLSATDHEPSTKTINLRTSKETGSGFSLSRSRDERVVRKYVKNLVSSVVEETAQKRVTQGKNARTNPGFRKRTKFGSGPSGHSALRSKDDNVAKKFRQTKSSLLVNERMEDKVKTKRDGDNQVGEGKMRNRSKRNKVESPEIELKVGLDKCSKKGDVMGAIELYDKAMREGIDMGQYHYTVVLYLCSSAALGVVRPAKSGSGSRSSNALDISSEVSSLNSMKLDEFRGVGNNGSAGSNESNSNIRMMVETGKRHRYTDKMKINSRNRFDNLGSASDEKENLIQFSNEGMKPNSQHLDRLNYVTRGYDDSSSMKDDSGHQKDNKIWVGEDVKKYAVQRGFEIYEKMCSDDVPMNEAALTSVARMAMSMGNGDLAFDMVKQMKPLGITPRLRSYSPALSAFCSSLDADKAFAVEKHMLEQGVYPEEPELEALLRASVGASKGDKVYYLLHKLRTTVRKVSPTTADLIVKWFESKAASSLGKTKWNQRLIKETIENKGGGWHGLGWLGEGNWIVSRSTVRANGLCECCGEKLVIIDLDPIETENFAESVASIAIKRDKNSSFQKFQKWLDYYGPFEAVVDAANVGLLSQKKFKPSKVNAAVNGIRQMLPSKKWPLVVLHKRHITGRKMDEPGNRAMFDKWKTADALYATPSGSNDDWYWLYAAIKFKSLLVTNDEMRDHTFQLLGNDFFPKWKERHQVHFSFSDAGPVFHMPPPCSVVIQESEKGHWHIPIASENDYEAERTWLCVTRAKSIMARQDSASRPEESPSFHINEGNAKSATQTEVKMKSQQLLNHGSHENTKYPAQEIYKNLRDILSASVSSNSTLILSDIEAAEKFGGCTIDFQI